MLETVRVNLDGSYGYRGADGAKRYYGPGQDIPVPVGLARTLGLIPASPLPLEESPPAPHPEPEEEGSKTPLPADFPGREYLAAAGYETVEALMGLTFDELVALKGIGKRTATAILEAVEEL